MAVAARPDEVADREIRLLGQDVRQQRVRGDVERHAQEDIGAALVDLARHPAVRHMKLNETVAGGKRHAVELADVPSAHDDPARVRILAQLLDHASDLVDVTSVSGCPGAPLPAVYGAELALLVRPLVPDRDTPLLERADIRLAAQEPEQLFDHGLEVYALGRDEWKARGEVETQLLSEHRERAGARAIHFAGTVLTDVAHQVEVGAHFRRSFRKARGARKRRPSIARPAASTGRESSWPIVSQSKAR